jgi:hypothetical protein
MHKNRQLNRFLNWTKELFWSYFQVAKNGIGIWKIKIWKRLKLTKCQLKVLDLTGMG